MSDTKGNILTRSSNASVNDKKQMNFTESLHHYKLMFFRLAILMTDADGQENTNRVIVSGQYTLALFFIFRLLQLLSFVFNPIFEFAWNADTTHWFIDACKYTRFDILLIGDSVYDKVPMVATLVVMSMIGALFIAFIMIAIDIEKQQHVDGSSTNVTINRPIYLPLVYYAMNFMSGPLFIPIMGILLGNLRCKNMDGSKCWDGSRIGLGVSSLFVAGLFYGFVIIYKLLVIKNDATSRNAQAMSHGRTQAFNIFVQGFLVFAYSVATSQKNTSLWALTLFSCACACGMFWSEWTMHPYFHQWSNIFACCTTSVFLWGTIALFVTQLFNDKDQTGGTVFFFIGCIIIVLLVRLLYLQQIEVVQETHVKDLKSVFDVDLKLRTLYDYEKLYKLNQALEKNSYIEEEHDIDVSSVDDITHEFEQAIRKFAHKPLIYIFQANMYKSVFDNDHVANNSLQACEDTNPALDCQYYIYKSRFEMERRISQGGDGQHVLRYMAVTQHLQAAVDLKQTAAYLKYQFWVELSEDIPDVERLNKLGGDVNSAIAKAHTHFKTVMAINRNSPNVMREYGDFLVNFLNDQATGQALIERADEHERKNAENIKKFDERNLGDATSLFDENTAIVTISGSRVTLGNITSVNQAFVRMFGRVEAECIGNNITCITPPPFSDLHDGFLKYHNRTGKGEIMNTTRQLFGMHKSGFIFPIHLHVKQVSGGLSDAIYLGIIRQSVTAETEHTAIVNHKTQQILRATAGWSRFFGQSLQDIASGRYNTEDMFPDWETAKDHLDGNHKSVEETICYRSRSGRTVEYENPTGKHQILVTAVTLEFRSITIDVIKVIEKSRVLAPNMMTKDKVTKDISNIISPMNGDVGQKPLSPSSSISDDSNEDMNNVPVPDSPHADQTNSNVEGKGQFLFPPNDVDQPRSGSSSPLHRDHSPIHRGFEDDSNNVYDDNGVSSSGILKPRRLKSKRSKKKKKRRHRSARSVHYEDDVDSRRSGKSGLSKSSAGTRNDWRTGLQRIRSLFLNESNSLEPAMARLRLTLVICIVGIILMSILVALLVIQSMENYNANVEILNKAGSRRSNVVSCAQYIRSIDLMRQTIIPTTDEAKYRTELRETAEALWATQTDLFFNAKMSDVHRGLYENPDIPIKRSEHGEKVTEKLGLIEAINEFQSAARLLSLEPMDKYNSENEHAYYVRANMETLLDRVNTSVNYYQETSISEANSITLLQTILLVATLCGMLLLVAILIVPAISKVEQTRKEIFSMFINEIPLTLLKKIKSGAFDLLTEDDKLIEGQAAAQQEGNKGVGAKTKEGDKQEQLLEKLRMFTSTNDTEEKRQLEAMMQSEIEMQQQREQKQKKIKVEKTHRRKDAFHFSNSQKYRLFGHISIIVLVAIAYFVSMYFWEQSVLNTSVDRVPEMNYSGRMRTMYRIAFYHTREAVVAAQTQSDFLTPNLTLSIEKAEGDSIYLDAILNGLLYGNANMGLPGSSSRSGDHIAVLFEDNCPLFANETACREFHGGLFTHGGSAAIAEFRNSIAEALAEAEEAGLSANKSTIVDQLTDDHWKDLEKMDEVYLNTVLEKNSIVYTEQGVTLVENFVSLRKVFLSIFVIFMVALYVFLYAPLVRHLDVSLKRTRGMLLMIPSQYMMSIPALSEILTDAAITAKM